jgi:hypothetical protein
MMGPPSTAATAAAATTCYSQEYSDCVQEYSFCLVCVIYLLSSFYTVTCNPCLVSESLFPFLGYLSIIFI